MCEVRGGLGLIYDKVLSSANLQFALTVHHEILPMGQLWPDLW